MFHIVDDNEKLGELSVEILKDAGFSAQAFSDSKQYLDHLSHHSFVPPKAIFTDICMPEVSGHDLIEKIKTTIPNQKIVVVSGYDDDYESLKDLVCHYLPKPYRPEQLLAVAEAIGMCEKVGIEQTKSACLSLKGESERGSFNCPLDCYSCN